MDRAKFNKMVGETLRRKRVNQKLVNKFTTKDLAAYLDMTPGNIYAIEKGVCSVSMVDFAKYCKFIGMNKSEIVELYQSLIKKVLS